MTGLRVNQNDGGGPQGADDQGRLVRTVGAETYRIEDEEIDLRRLWRLLKADRLIISAIVLAFAIGGTAYALLATEWYRAQVVLLPAIDDTAHGIGADLGGLASIVGLRVGESDAVESLEVLRSRDFARDFIAEFDLVTVLLGDQWDLKAERWIASDARDWPDERDAVSYFQKKVFQATENTRTGVVTVSVRWKDPQLAARWANSLVERLNARMRQQRIAEANANITFLTQELSKSSVVALQQSIGRLLESEMQQAMIAEGRMQFAYKIIESADVPKEPSHPRKLLIIVLAIAMGGTIATVVAWVRLGRFSE